MMKLFLVLVLSLYTLQAESLFSNDAQKNRSEYIGALKDLIIATQKTRGETNSYLNGNSAAQFLIYSDRQDAKDAIGKMESLPFAADPIIDRRATAISQKLIALNARAFKSKNSAKTFAQYTELISQMMMLAQSTANRDADKLNPIAKDLTSIMMNTMLPLTEAIGQLRGFGSGLAAKGSATKEQKRKLMQLIMQAKSISSRFEPQMRNAVSKYNEKYSATSVRSDIGLTMTLIGGYISYSKDNLMDANKKVDPSTYFSSGTKIISSIIKIYNINVKVMASDAKGWL